MVRNLKCASLALVLTAAPMAFSPAQAQDQAQNQTGGQPAAAAPAPAETLDPQAIAALEKMGASLRKLERFSVVSDGAMESVFANGQKLDTAVRTTYSVELPGRIAVDFQTDNSHSRLYYNGKAVTLVGMNNHKYVRFPASGTVGEMFNRAEDDYGITLPLRELFLWGSPLSDAEQPRAGFKVGDSIVDGVSVEHFAFRQSEMDWEIWLEKSERAFPRKLVITRTDVPHQPRFTAHFTWDTAREIEPAAFEWTPTADYQLIDYGTAAATGAPAPKAVR